MFQKQKQLAIFNENIENLYVIENNTVIVFLAERGRKSAGGKNEGFSHYVIENIGSEITIWGIHLTQVTPTGCGRNRRIHFGGASRLLLWRP